MARPIIELGNVDLFYDKGKPVETHALSNVAFSVEAGEYLGLFGPSGCGKSSILYSIAGIEQPTTGNVSCDGKNLQHMSENELALYRQSSVGIIFQNFNLVLSINILDNVMLPMAFRGVPTGERRAKALRILTRLGMQQFAKRFPYELSGGQQQRVGIARALANDPPIILADEPVGSLDSVNANNVLDFLAELHQKDRRTIVLVTHEAWSLRDAERIIYMKDGKILKTESHTPGKTKGAPGTDTESPTVHAVRHLHPVHVQESLNNKALAALYLRGYRPEELERFELFIDSLFAGAISIARFAELLDLSWHKGGMGLWRQKAQSIARSVHEAQRKHATVTAIVNEIEKTRPKSLLHELRELAHWLLTDTGHRPDRIPYHAFTDEIRKRLLRQSISSDFVSFLNTPQKKGGMGMRIETARRVATKLDGIV